MVKPEKLFTRDMIYDMHKELTARIPNVNTPTTTYAFDDMAVECRNFEDVRIFFSAFSTTIPLNILFGRTSPNSTLNSTLILDSPESPTTSTIEDTIEFPDSPNSILDTPQSPTPSTIEDTIEFHHNPNNITIEAPATSSPTTRYNLELKRTNAYYDYTTASTNTIFPPSTSSPSSNKHCINDCDCDDSSSTSSSTGDEFHNINLPKLKKYKLPQITYVLKEARSTLTRPARSTLTRPATTPAPPFTMHSFQPISVPISIGSFVGYRRSISPSSTTKEYVLARVEDIVDFDTMCVKVLRNDPEYIFYTFDETEESEHTHIVDLVLLNPPFYVYEPSDTQFVHKYYFHRNIEEDIENVFNTLNM